MKFRRINEKTINCIITPEDLKLGGIELRDLFERKEEALKFLQSYIVSAAASEKFDLSGNYTNMRIAVLQDHTISLTLSESPEAMPDLMGALGLDPEKKAGKGHRGADAEADKAVQGSAGEEVRKKTPLAEDENDKKLAIHQDGGNTPQKQETENKDCRTEYGVIFLSLHDAIRGCRGASAAGEYRSSLYKNRFGEEYFLIMEKDGSRNIGFDKMALSLSEFGQMLDAWTDIAYIKEHETCILRGKAIETLAALKA